MGLRSTFRLASSATGLSPDSNVVQMRSPWTVGQLETVVLTDIFGSADLPVSRAEAISVPAVAKARHLVCGLSRQPIKTYRGPDPVDDPAWVYRTNSQPPPTTRLLWTLDDLFFSGWSLWATERGQAKQITDAVRVPPERWSFNPDGAVLVDDEPVDAEQVILFSGPYEGILTAGAATIRAAKNLERAWAKRVRSPVPVTELHQVDDSSPLEDDEVHDLVDQWATMIDEGGGVAFTPSGIEAKYPAAQGNTDALFVEGRNAVTLDVARFCSVAGALLDASLSTASLTYTTQEGTRDRFLDETAAFWLTPIEARLSMDDVCPRGQRMAFDLSELLTVPPTGRSPVRLD